MNLIESFLNSHKRHCSANQGDACTCALFDARAELARLQAIETAAKVVAGYWVAANEETGLNAVAFADTLEALAALLDTTNKEQV